MAQQQQFSPPTDTTKYANPPLCGFEGECTSKMSIKAVSQKTGKPYWKCPHSKNGLNHGIKWATGDIEDGPRENTRAPPQYSKQAYAAQQQQQQRAPPPPQSVEDTNSAMHAVLLDAIRGLEERLLTEVASIGSHVNHLRRAFENGPIPLPARVGGKKFKLPSAESAKPPKKKKAKKEQAPPVLVEEISDDDEDEEQPPREVDQRFTFTAPFFFCDRCGATDYSSWQCICD